jgi:hypothetical protein
MVTLLLVAAIAFCVMRFSVQCRKTIHPDPPDIVSRTLDVSAVQNGSTIIVFAGLLERRTATVTLTGIAAPTQGESFGPESCDNLERLAGKKIRVEYLRRRLLRASDGSVAHEEAVGDGEQLQAGRNYVGTVYGESGACLNLEQVKAGLAKCSTADAPRAWRNAEAEAKKSKIGLWAGE